MQPHNQFHMTVATPPPGGWNIVCRRTPTSEKTVPEIVAPGDRVETTYGSGPYFVKEVTGPFRYEPRELPGQVFEHYSLVLTDASERKTSGAFHINELVAVGGRLLKLFHANEDEVLILGRGLQPQAPKQLGLF